MPWSDCIWPLSREMRGQGFLLRYKILRISYRLFLIPIHYLIRQLLKVSIALPITVSFLFLENAPVNTMFALGELQKFLYVKNCSQLLKSQVSFYLFFFWFSDLSSGCCLRSPDICMYNSRWSNMQYVLFFKISLDLTLTKSRLLLDLEFDCPNDVGVEFVTFPGNSSLLLDYRTHF